MQKSITRLFLVACASLSVANLQAMDSSRAAALREKAQQQQAVKSQVEQLQDASQDEDQKSTIAAFREAHPEFLTRASVYTATCLVVALVSTAGAVTALPVAATLAAIEAANYLTKQDAAAKNQAEIAKEAVEAK
jgi:hypothetical protein